MDCGTIYFTGSPSALEYKQKWNAKWGSTHAHGIFTILYKYVISKVGNLSCQLR